jgi:hypothetical protein
MACYLGDADAVAAQACNFGYVFSRPLVSYFYYDFWVLGCTYLIITVHAHRVSSDSFIECSSTEPTQIPRILLFRYGRLRTYFFFYPLL